MDRIEPFLYEWTSQHRGSISAEHGNVSRVTCIMSHYVTYHTMSRCDPGLGFKKRNFIHFSKSSSAVALMKQIKGVFDPQGIMNPYKVLPDA